MHINRDLAIVVSLFFSTSVLANALPNVKWSDPPSGYIDVAQDRDSAGTPEGIDSVVIAFEEPIALEVTDVVVISDVAAPEVMHLKANKDQTEWTIVLDNTIGAGGTTVVSFKKGALFLKYGFHPGDVNLDNVSNKEDVQALKQVISNNIQDEWYDINQDGIVNEDDVTRLYTLLDGTDGGISWGGHYFPAERDHICCCDGQACEVVSAGGCANPEPCPCGPSSCVPPGMGG